MYHVVAKKKITKTLRDKTLRDVFGDIRGREVVVFDDLYSVEPENPTW